MTISRVELPLQTKTPPPSGVIFAAAEIRGCAGSDPPQGTGITPELFFLETTSGGRETGWQASEPLKRPALERRIFVPNECATGWVTFRIPKNQKPVYVSFVGAEIGRWRIP